MINLNNDETNEIKQDYEVWHKQSEERMDEKFKEAMQSFDKTNKTLDDTINNIDNKFYRIGKRIDIINKWLKAMQIAYIIAIVIIVISILILAVAIRLYL